LQITRKKKKRREVNEMIKIVGVIGAGNMGGGIVEKLVEADYQVFACDPSAKAQERAKGFGAQIAGSPREVAETTDMIVLSLPGPKEIEGVVAGEGGILEGLKPEQIVADASTVDPGTSKRMAEMVSGKGGFYLDTPVLGRPSAVGRWLLPVGGDEKALERAKPVLETFAKKTVHVGASGAGNALKLLNNLMFSAINAVTAEVLAIAAKSDISPKLLYETIDESGAATVSGLFHEAGRKIVERDFDALFAMDLLCKDVRLGIQMAKELGAPPPLTSFVQTLNEITQSRGFGAEDTCALVKVFEAMYG
jgi:3-hydroxyisobutyrate dehydrogenase-like beta-hydroxyacid dehydrogenase